MKENPNIVRLATDVEPDLVRTESGYIVNLYITPSIEERQRAVIEVHAGTVLIDTLDVPWEKGHEVYRHTTLYSEPYAEALR